MEQDKPQDLVDPGRLERGRENDRKYEETKAVLHRLRGSGGVPLSVSHVTQSLHGFRALDKRGYTTAEFVSDLDAIGRTFRESFPNPHTRRQNVKAVLAVLSGMTDEEYARKYHTVSRSDLVRVLRCLNTESITEITGNKIVTESRGKA